MYWNFLEKLNHHWGHHVQAFEQLNISMYKNSHMISTCSSDSCCVPSLASLVCLFSCDTDLSDCEADVKAHSLITMEVAQYSSTVVAQNKSNWLVIWLVVDLPL